MTNLDIDRRLALAIGYRPEDVDELCGSVRVRRYNSWQWFDHQQEHTIYPIAEKFKMFPNWDSNYDEWAIYKSGTWTFNTDPRTCIALATIEAAERGALTRMSASLSESQRGSKCSPFPWGVDGESLSTPNKALRGLTTPAPQHASHLQ